MGTEHFIQEHFGAQKGTNWRLRVTSCGATIIFCAAIFFQNEPAHSARKITLWELSATVQWQNGTDAETLSLSSEMGKAHTLQSESLCGRAQLKENGISLELGTWREHRQELTHPDAPSPKDCVIRTTSQLACPSLPCSPTNVVIALPAPRQAPKGWVNLPPASATSLTLRDVRVVSTTRSAE